MNNRGPDFTSFWTAREATGSLAHVVKQAFHHRPVVLCLIIVLLPCCGSPPSDCGGTFRGSGTIKSPNHPYTYHAKRNCSWYLQAHGGNQILLMFEESEIDSTDALCIYNSSTLIMRLSEGRQPFNLTLGPSVTLLFISDESIGNRGFLLKWATVSTCLPEEYYNGFICMPCTEPSTYLSRKVRNCSQDSDAVYAEPGSESYAPSDVIDKNAQPSGAVPQEEPRTETTDAIHKKQAQPSGAVPQQEHTVTTDLPVYGKYLAPFVGVLSILAVIGVVIYLCVEKWRNRR